MTAFQDEKPTYIIKGQGRTAEECSITLIEQGTYKGFGFIERSETILHFEDFINHITRYKSTYHTTKILQAYHKKNGEKDVVSKRKNNVAN